MPIFIRTFASDSNGTSATPFVGIPVPVGVTDGDLILAGVTIPSTGVTVTPPSDDWELVTATDKAFAPQMLVYAKTAFNEQGTWVFALSASARAVGAAVVYGNVDPFGAVEASALALTASSASHGIPGITASLDQDEIVLFLGANTSGSYTPAAGFTEVLRKTQASQSTLEIHHDPLQDAGDLAATSATFSTSANGAAVLVVLRPSASQFTVDDVRARLIDALPRGVENVYDLEPGGDFYNLFNAAAALIKVYGFDLVEQARLEIAPQTSRYKLDEWLRLFGLESTKTGRTGTIPQKQALLVSAWRAAGGQGSSIPTISATIGTLLGYRNPHDLLVIECDRPALTAANTHTITPSATISAGGTSVFTIPVGDSGMASSMGAQLSLTMGATSPAAVSVTLTDPGSALAKTFAAGCLGSATITSSDVRKLYSQGHAGVTLSGNWTVSIHNGSGASITVDSLALFVESIGYDSVGADGTGAAAFYWHVVVDSTKINGGNGGAVDYPALFEALRSLEQSHTFVSISTDTVFAIPDDATTLPDQVFPS